MTLSEIGYRYRPVVLTVVLLLMAFGVFSYFTLPAKEDPTVTIREAVVTTMYPGLSAGRVERLITKTLEEAIRQVPEVEGLRSTSSSGLSVIHVEVHDRYFDLDQIWDEVRQKIEAAQRDLPDGTWPPVFNDDFGDVAVLTVALRGADHPMADVADIAEHIRDTLYTVAGTKRVDILGVQPDRIYIEVANARLAEFGISPDHLNASLRQQNIIRPGGVIDTGDRVFPIEATGSFDSVEQIREALIPVPGTGAVVPLRDLAEVRREPVDPPDRLVYFDGEPVVMLTVAMLDGYRVLDFVPAVRTLLDGIEATLPVGYALDVVTDQSVQVEGAVFGVTANVLQTLAIVLAVVILFLGVRTGLIVGSIVPAVMLITLAVMGFAGMDLQRMSLATLVIALGLLVDNGIVIAEDFKRRLEDGASRDQALREGGRQLAMPLLSSTLTTILVFLPLMLAEHVAGEYTRSISLVVLIALLTSWTLAMVMTPVLCHRFVPAPRLDPNARPSPMTRVFGLAEAVYGRLLRIVLSVRWPFLILVLAALAAAIGAMQTVPAKFFPDSDRAQVLIYLDLPAGVSTSTTEARMRAVLDRLDDRDRFPAIDSHVGYVGFGGPRFVLSLTPVDPAAHRGFVVVTVADAGAMDRTIAGLRATFRAEFPELSARVSSMFLGPSDSRIIEVQVIGPDAGTLFDTAETLRARLAGIRGAIDIRHDWENRVTSLVVAVDQARARRAGVTSADIARSLEGYYSGHDVSEFREGDDIFPIVARAEADERDAVERIRTLSVYPQGGGMPVPLEQVADIEFRNTFSTIAREDLVRTITVEARHLTLSAEDLVPLVDPILADLEPGLPPGHRLAYAGVVTESAEGRAALAANAPLCLAVILVLLVAQFNGFARPLIILATIPLMMIGVVIGLVVMGANVGFMVILGLYSLAGIVINNVIVLIDRIDTERGAGVDPFEAIVGASVRRLRPITASTVTTVLSLLPLILFRDPLFYGMATVIAFGLFIGTAINLLILPVLYSLVFRIRPAGRRPRAATRRRRQRDAGPVPVPAE